LVTVRRLIEFVAVFFAASKMACLAVEGEAVVRLGFEK